MMDDKLKQKAHGEQEQYFRKKDADLIAKIRQRVKLSDLTNTLAEKLQIDDPALLRRIMDLGITLETGPAFLLAPLVQVAWAEGKVTPREKRAVLGAAAERGVAKGSPSFVLVEKWLDERPPDALFAAAVDAIKAGLAVLPEAERAERIQEITALCRQIAATSGGLARELGLSSGVDGDEQAILAAVTKRLTS